MGRPRVVVVTGEACRPDVVLGLAAAEALVVVWSPDAERCGALARLVLEAGGRAASFVGPEEARDAMVAFTTEQFGGVDDFVDQRGAAG